MKQPSKNWLLLNRYINQALGYITKSLIFLCFANVPVQAQNNLVVNGDFEEYSSCPFGGYQISKAIGWDTIRAGGGGEPEYANICANSTQPAIGVPFNYCGYQQTHSGVGYSFYYVYFKDTNQYQKREYIQGILKNKLIAGKSYCVNFFVSIANISRYAIDEFGAYLDNGSVKSDKEGVANVIPQIKSLRVTGEGGTYLKDSINWMQIKGSFISNGDEQYITLGNFRHNSETNYIEINTTCAECLIAYYLIDDVSVIEINTKANAGNDTTIIKGDTAFVGLHDIGDSYTWYANGIAFYTGSEAGLYVTPTVNTTYIVKQTVCSVITYDTCVVTVNPVSVRELEGKMLESVKLWPNPVLNGQLSIENGEWVTDIKIYDLLGVRQPIPHWRGQGVDVSSLAKGIYMLHLQGTKGSVVRKIVIE